MSQSPSASTSRLPLLRPDALAQLPLSFGQAPHADTFNYFAQPQPQPQLDDAVSPPMPMQPLASTSAASDRSPSVETDADGNSKKRGPKTRPGADDRRRELHRRAQKSHREKKETHMKDLEDQVNGLPESYKQIFATMHRVSEDNNSMRVAMGQDPSNLGDIIRSTPLQEIYERYYTPLSSLPNLNPTTSAPANPPPSQGGPTSAPAGLAAQGPSNGTR